MNAPRKQLSRPPAIPLPQSDAGPARDGKRGSPRRSPALRPGSRRAPFGELSQLRARLGIAETTLRAIRSGEVDSVMVAGKEGSQVFTLAGEDHLYRVLIECMNEGALTLTGDKIILYANECFARLVKCPLEQVTGSCFRRFLSAKDSATLRPPMKGAATSGAKLHVMLRASDGSRVPVLLSIRELAKEGSNKVIIGMVVTNMTEAKRNEEMLRALTHRVVQVQETERGRVALELHGHITQLLCAVLVRCQTLADKLSSRDGAAKKEAIKLREMLGQAASEVECISRHLRPSILDELGLVAVLRDTSTEFAERMGVALELACVKLTTRLPADIELTFYRILQETLRNVEQHARARQVTVRLTKQGGGVQLVIRDDGIGFDPKKNYPTTQNGKSGLGLLSMRERASYVGGTLKITSAPRAGTEIEVRIPLGNAARDGVQVASIATKP